VDDLERRMAASLAPKKKSPHNLSAREKVYNFKYYKRVSGFFHAT
jgi:hypothetical protein